MWSWNDARFRRGTLTCGLRESVVLLAESAAFVAFKASSVATKASVARSTMEQEGLRPPCREGTRAAVVTALSVEGVFQMVYMLPERLLALVRPAFDLVLRRIRSLKRCVQA